MTTESNEVMQQNDTVFIVDDDPAIGEGLKNLMESVGIKAEHFVSAEIFREQWDASRGGCLLLDARLPGMSGMELQEDLNAVGIGIPVIFMTAHGDVPMVRKVLKAGAVEFLTKPFQKEELLNAVKLAFAFDHTRRANAAVEQSIKARVNLLTEREREVLAMVTAGLLNKQIAAQLNLSEITIKLHRRHVMDKMRAESPDLAGLAPQKLFMLTDRLDRLRKSRWQWCAMVMLLIVLRMQQGTPLVAELTVAIQFLLFLALPAKSNSKFAYAKKPVRQALGRR
jgi:FixJ family two-component response regulator